MKKIISIIICMGVAMGFTPSSFVIKADAAIVDDVKHSYNFESCSVDAPIGSLSGDGWRWQAINATTQPELSSTCGAVVKGDESNKYLQIIKKNTYDKTLSYAKKLSDYYGTNAKYKLTFRGKLVSGNVTIGLGNGTGKLFSTSADVTLKSTGAMEGTIKTGDTTVQNKTLEGKSFTAGEWHTFTFKADRVKPKNIDFYIDNTFIQTLNTRSLNTGDDFSYFLIGVNKNLSDVEFHIDDLCLSIEKKVISEIKFAEGSGYIDLSNSQDKSLTVECTNDIDIERVEFSVNGSPYKVIDSAPYTIDVEELGLGNHTVSAVAYDATGDASSSISINAELTVKTTDEIFSDTDFIVADANTLNSGIGVYSQRGYVKTDSVDDEHTSCLLIGIDEANENYDTSKTPYMEVPTKGKTDNAEINFDMYVSAAAYFRFGFLQESPRQVSMIAAMQKNSEEITVGNSSSPFELNKWINVSIKFDETNKIYSVYFDGNPVGQENTPFPSGMDEVNYFRFVGPVEDDLKGYMAIDNVSVTTDTKAPGITAVNYDGEKVTISLSGALYEESINTETVSLIDDEGRSVELEKAGFKDNVVSIRPLDSLREGATYTAIIGENARITYTMELGAKIKSRFTIPNEGFAVTSGVFVDKKVMLTLSNGLENEETYVVVVTVQNGAEFVNSKIFELTASGNSVSQKDIDLSYVEDGQTAYVYVWSSLQQPQFLSNKIYSNTY